MFHAADLSCDRLPAREVGSGLAVSALIGTVVRLLSGALLDRGIRCSWPVRTAVGHCRHLIHPGQLQQLPADNCCWATPPTVHPALKRFPLPATFERGYALVAADALESTSADRNRRCGMLRTVYSVEAVCMGAVFLISLVQPCGPPAAEHPSQRSNDPAAPPAAGDQCGGHGIRPSTEALPLDLVRGGLAAPSESHSRPDRPSVDLAGDSAGPARSWPSRWTSSGDLRLSCAGSEPSVLAASCQWPSSSCPLPKPEEPPPEHRSWPGAVFPVLRHQRHRGAPRSGALLSSRWPAALAVDGSRCLVVSPEPAPCSSVRAATPDTLCHGGTSFHQPSEMSSD